MCVHKSKLDAKSERWACLVQVGAQVMLLRNLELTGPADRMLVNGSRGVVRPHRVVVGILFSGSMTQ